MPVRSKRQSWSFESSRREKTEASDVISEISAGGEEKMRAITPSPASYSVLPPWLFLSKDAAR